MSRPTDVPTVYGSSAVRVILTPRGAVAREGTSDPVTGHMWPVGWHVRSDDYAQTDGIGLVYWTDDAVAGLMWDADDAGNLVVRHAFTGAVLATGRPEDGDPIGVALLTVAQDYGPALDGGA